MAWRPGMISARVSWMVCDGRRQAASVGLLDSRCRTCASSAKKGRARVLHHTLVHMAPSGCEHLAPARPGRARMRRRRAPRAVVMRPSPSSVSLETSGERSREGVGNGTRSPQRARASPHRNRANTPTTSCSHAASSSPVPRACPSARGMYLGGSVADTGDLGRLGDGALWTAGGVSMARDHFRARRRRAGGRELLGPETYARADDRASGEHGDYFLGGEGEGDARMEGGEKGTCAGKAMAPSPTRRVRSEDEHRGCLPCGTRSENNRCQSGNT